jgi:hypothetical protein
MLVWIFGYALLGAVIAGACLGLSRRSGATISLARFALFLTLWPILLMTIIVAVLMGRRSRNH